METAEPCLSATAVSKRFGDRTVVSGVDFEMHSRELVALLGPNGAGKTTLISLMTGQRPLDSGDIRLFGGPPSLAASRRSIGVSPQNVAFPKTLRVQEILQLVRAHFEAPAAVEELVISFGLSALMLRQAGGLSGGELRRVALAVAFAGKPKAVFLDEPTAGLDPEGRHQLWTVLRQYVEGGGSALLTTHYLEEAAALATRVVVMNKGRIVQAGDVRTIERTLSLTRIRFRSSARPEGGRFAAMSHEDGWWVLETADADRAVVDLVRAGHPFHDLEVAPLGLEAAVLHLIREDGRT